jgi:hypothetical protein
MAFCGVENYAFAQQTLIDVKIDSAAILIGEQTKLHLTLTTDKDKQVQVLIPADTLMRGVEVLERSKPDTTWIENDRMLVKQDVLITSFDSSLYLLPPVLAIDGRDTILSNQVALKVSTVPVNVDKPEEFADIKDVWKPPFVWSDYYPWIIGILAVLLLMALAYYIVKRIRERKSLIPFAQPEKPKLPPYEQAIKELDEIKQSKLWQQGKEKEYFTSITDTLRRYLVDRFGINAMEKTSAEILDSVKGIDEIVPAFEKLEQVLKLADFVKFAKFRPLPDENDLSLVNAYFFVNQTKPVEIPNPEEAKDEGKDVDEKQADNTNELKTTKE